MSMPNFPELDPEITCDRALSMILASIAMEELALSHILNAEGEKLQYVLGTLEGSCLKEHDIDEVLKVNQSITCLLDSVTQNQMILKNKMDKAIHALSEICPRQPEPPTPVCICPHKCSAVFKGDKKCGIWHVNSSLHWGTEGLCGKCARLDSCDKTKIELNSKGRYMISFSINVKSDGCKCNAAVSLQMKKYNQTADIYTVYGHVLCCDKPVTLSAGGIIVENCDNISSLSLKLKSPNSLIIKDSMLSIIEI